jgi:hypothetical protein
MIENDEQVIGEWDFNRMRSQQMTWANVIKNIKY